MGIGSPFGWDRLGWMVVKALSYNSHLKTLKHLQLEILDRPHLNILSMLENTQRIIIIDAVVSHDPIGQIYQLTAKELEQQQLNISSHNIGLAQSISLARSLNLLPDELIFYGINVGSKLNDYTKLESIAISLRKLRKTIKECFA